MALVSSNSKPGIHIAWKTVTYRSVFLAVAGVLAAIGFGMHLAFPQFTEGAIKSANGMVGNLLDKVASNASSGKSGVMNSQQAQTTALDGTVRVKKSNSNTWVRAD